MARKKRKSMKDKVKADSQRSASGGNYLKLPQGTEFFTAEPGGRCKIDLLPYVVTDTKHPDGINVGDIWYKRPFRIHRDVGVDKEIVVCPRSDKKPCPICDHRESLLTTKGTDESVTKALKPKDRVLYLPRPLSGVTKGKKLIWDFSFYNFQEQLDAEMNDPENEEFCTFTDLEGGYSLRIRFAEKTFDKNKYAKTERIDFDARDDLDESILEETINLDKVLNILDYKVLQNKFFEMEEEDTGKGDIPGNEEVDKETTEIEKAELQEAKEETISLPTEKAIKKMSRKKLAGVIKEFELDALDPEDYDDTDELRDAVIIELHGGNTSSKTEEKQEEVDSKEHVEKKENRPKCPHGHEWGTADDPSHGKDCDTCEKWDDCIAST